MYLCLWSLLLVPPAPAETKFDYGAALRLRQEIWDNVVGLGAVTSQYPNGITQDRSYFRLRTTLWGKAVFTPDYGAYLRFANEMQYQVGPYKRNAQGDQLYADEVVFDNLYFDAKNIFGLPVDIRIGRQDFLGPNTYGEGFLIMDGTPGDGSRTFYFNAAKATARFNRKDSLDLLYITDPFKDTYLPSLHQDDSKRKLEVSSEQGFVAYGRIRSIENLSLEPYYIFKQEKWYYVGKVFVPQLDINALGARAVYSTGGWNLGGEFAFQFGEYDNGIDRTALGGYLFAGRKYDSAKWKPEIDLRFVYLSGDDPSTKDKNEAWNPLFSRNASWNDSMIYNFPVENSVLSNGVPGYWTNIMLAKVSLVLNFSPSTDLLLSYQYLWAPEKNAQKTAMLSTEGKDRGSLPIALLSHRFSKNLDGYLHLEYFIPGDFYSPEAKDVLFFKWQLQYKM